MLQSKFIACHKHFKKCFLCKETGWMLILCSYIAYHLNILKCYSNIFGKHFRDMLVYFVDWNAILRKCKRLNTMPLICPTLQNVYLSMLGTLLLVWILDIFPGLQSIPYTWNVIIWTPEKKKTYKYTNHNNNTIWYPDD